MGDLQTNYPRSVRTSLAIAPRKKFPKTLSSFHFAV